MGIMKFSKMFDLRSRKPFSKEFIVLRFSSAVFCSFSISFSLAKNASLLSVLSSFKNDFELAINSVKFLFMVAVDPPKPIAAA